MTITADLHTEQDIHKVEVACFRTDYSDDAKWERLLELAAKPGPFLKVCRKYAGGGSYQCGDEGGGMAFMCVLEGPQFENLTVQDLVPRATETFFIADQQSMKDDTFLLVHTGYEFEDDEETDDLKCTGTVLKSGRLLASEIWAPATNLPIGNCDFEDYKPFEP